MLEVAADSGFGCPSLSDVTLDGSWMLVPARDDPTMVFVSWHGCCSIEEAGTWLCLNHEHRPSLAYCYTAEKLFSAGLEDVFSGWRCCSPSCSFCNNCHV